MRLPTAIFAIGLAAVAAGCTATADGGGDAAPAKRVLAAGPQDATCQADFPGHGPGWLTFRNGKPVGYRTNTYRASSVSLSGNTVRIDQARFHIKSASSQALVGDWTLGRYHAKNLKFACK